MDESSLRNYFRRALGVQPGASRKELKLCRDKRGQRWRALLPAPADAVSEEGAAVTKLVEQRIALTNTAYDCLSNADKFRDYQSKVNAGEIDLPDLDAMLAVLGDENIKPIAPRLLAKRQAQLQEKLDRINTLAVESVQKGGHDQALKLTQNRLPDPDFFYDSVYNAALEAGNKTLKDELDALAANKFEVDDTFKSDLESLIVDQAEIISHKEYDRLEDRAASSTPTPAMPRFVAMILTVVILGLVLMMCLYGISSPVPTATAGGDNQAVAPTAAPAATAVMPAAPAPGIANSVFNRSTFGPSAGTATSTAVDPVVVPPPATATDTSTVAASNYVPTPAPASNQTVAPAAPAHGAVTAQEVSSAEKASGSGSAPVDSSSAAPLVGFAGAAGMAGYGSPGTKAGGASYLGAVNAAMKGSMDESLSGFRSAYAAGHFTEALYNQAVILVIQGQYQPAVELYDQVLAANPSMPQALYNRAHSHQLLAMAADKNKNFAQERQQLASAVANYDLAIKADPHLSQAFYNRGLALFALGQKEKALADFNSARQLSSMMQAATYNSAIVDATLKKSKQTPSGTAPGAPIGPVGPAGPS